MATTAIAGGTVGAAGAARATPVARERTQPSDRAQQQRLGREDSSVDFESWFADVDNYDGVVDATGQSTVEVTVGATGNDGAFAFDPPAVRVDPGTTVVWEWSGEGGSHDVAAEDGAYGSRLQSEAGATFEHTFDDEGISYYVCTPHEALGMKGAIVVGDVLVGAGSSAYPDPDYGDWFDGVPNFDGTVDATGRDEIRVEVGGAATGQSGQSGQFVFEPAAVRIDPGTTVVWEWIGDGEDHTVTAADGSYESDSLRAAGSVFALTFDGDGISRYRCETHDGMRGAIVVGDGVTSETTFSPLATLLGGGIASALLGLLGYGLYLHASETTSQGRVAAELETERRRDRHGGRS